MARLARKPSAIAIPTVVLLILFCAVRAFAQTTPPTPQASPALLPPVPAPPVPTELFLYDPHQPLDVADSLVATRDGVTIHDITFASPKGGRVPAYLVVPQGKGPFAAVVFGHWGEGNRTEFLPEAILYARAGAVSVLIGYPWTRPEPWRRSLQYMANPENDLDAYAQAVIDLRRAIDLLLERGDVDPARIAYVGHSYGAQWGAILAAVDKRMKTCILAGGIPDAASIWREGDDPDIVEVRRTVPPAAMDRYLSVLAPLDAVRYVPYAARVSLLFQFARFERNFKEPAMRRYAAAASEPKTVLWYDTGHDLNDVRALIDRAAWLRERIGIQDIGVRAPDPTGD